MRDWKINVQTKTKIFYIKRNDNFKYEQGRKRDRNKKFSDMKKKIKALKTVWRKREELEFIVNRQAVETDYTEVILLPKDELNKQDPTEDCIILHTQVTCNFHIESWSCTHIDHAEIMYDFSSARNLQCISPNVLEPGVNVDVWSICNSDGNTPLHLSALTDKEKCFDLLIKYGANCNLRNKFGYRPLDIIFQHKNIDLLNRILQEDIDINMHVKLDNNERVLPVVYACGKWLNALEPLLWKGAVVNCYTKTNLESLWYQTKDSSYFLYRPFDIFVDEYFYGQRVSHSKHLNRSPLLLLQHICNAIEKRLDYMCVLNNKNSILHVFAEIISAGGSLQRVDKQVRMNLEGKLFRTGRQHVIKFLYESGYQFATTPYVTPNLKVYNANPCTLQSICCCTIRESLQPNAWVGIKNLQIPNKLKQLITLNYGLQLLNFSDDTDEDSDEGLYT